MTTILYQTGGEWGLPALTPGGLQAEAYLRFTQSEFNIEQCSTASRSPTGVLPALETDLGILPPPEGGSDLAAASAIVEHLQAHGRDTDARLSPAQRAEALAFATLIRSRLDAATQFTMWREPRGYEEYRKAAYQQLPFPLNWVVPWMQRREVVRQLGNVTAEQVYPQALDALAALSDKLRASPGGYLLGERPSSADALLFGHLAFYLHSTVAAPVLKSKVQALSPLGAYVERVLAEAFSREVPPPPPLDESAAYDWSDAAQGQPKAKKAPPTAEELRLRRGNALWLAGAGAAVGAYVLFSGQYLQVVDVEEYEDDVLVDDDGDEDDDE